MLDRILDPAILGLLIPIVAIVVGGGVALSALWIRHRERMAMISMGMHPDPRERDDEDDDDLELEDAPLLESGERETLEGLLRSEKSRHG
jgi:hypothetical protein